MVILSHFDQQDKTQLLEKFFKKICIVGLELPYIFNI